MRKRDEEKKNRLTFTNTFNFIDEMIHLKHIKIFLFYYIEKNFIV